MSALGSTGTVSVPVSVSASFCQSICWDRIPPNGGHTKSHTVVTTSESATAAAAAHICSSTRCDGWSVCVCVSEWVVVNYWMTDNIPARTHLIIPRPCARTGANNASQTTYTYDRNVHTHAHTQSPDTGAGSHGSLLGGLGWTNCNGDE